MNDVKKSFPSGFKENEKEINRLKYELEDAISRRDYKAAAFHQKSLDERYERRKQILNSQIKDNTGQELERLRLEQSKEEEALHEKMERRLQELIMKEHEKLMELDKKHIKQIADLDELYSNESFCMLRRNPTVTSFRKAEIYYSRKADYAVAESYKNNISEQTLNAMERNEKECDNIVNNKVETTIYRQEKEKEGVKLHLEFEKNRLKKELMLEMGRIQNKYAKLRERLIGNKAYRNHNENRMTFTDRTGLLDKLEEGVTAFNGGVSLYGLIPAKPASARGVFSPALQKVPVIASLQSNKLQSINLVQASKTPRTFKMEPTSVVPSGVRNPRVKHALERSLIKRERQMFC